MTRQRYICKYPRRSVRVLIFQTYDPDTVRDLLHSGQFKPNSGAMVVDFLLRHGFVTPENEPNILEIRRELARQLGMAVSAPLSTEGGPTPVGPVRASTTSTNDQ